MVGTMGFEPMPPTPPSVVRYQAALRPDLLISHFYFILQGKVHAKITLIFLMIFYLFANNISVANERNAYKFEFFDDYIEIQTFGLNEINLKKSDRYPKTGNFKNYPSISKTEAYQQLTRSIKEIIQSYYENFGYYGDFHNNQEKGIAIHGFVPDYICTKKAIFNWENSYFI